jgi:putative peptidoglycan lipid II flippase
MSAPPRSGTIGRATLVMGIGTALSRATGFLRVAIIAWAIGGAESKLPDTYQLANTLPNIVYQMILGEVVVTVFIPIFVEYVTSRKQEETRSLATTVLVAVAGIAALFSALAVIFAPQLIKIYSFRLQGPQRAAQEEVGAFFLRLFMPQMFFYALGMVITGLLNAHRRFTAPAFAPVLNNLIVIGTFIAFRTMHRGGAPGLFDLSSADKLLLGLGTTAGVVVMTLAYLPSALRLPRWFSLSEVNWKHPALARMRGLAKWALAYVLVNQIGLWVVKALANGKQGGVAAYDTSFILYSLPYGIVAVSVFTALVPVLSEYHVRGDRASMRHDLWLGFRMTAFLVLPASAGFVALSRPLMRLLLEHGVFTSRSSDLFADTFAYMAIGLAGYAAFQQIMRAFYSMQDTRTPWLINSAGVLVNIITAFPLFVALGVPGLGLSHAISYLAALAVGAFVLTSRLGGWEGRSLISWLFPFAAASVAAGAAAWLVARFLEGAVDTSAFGGQAIQVLASVAVGIAVYLGIAAAFRFEEFGRAMRLSGKLLGRAG